MFDVLKVVVTLAMVSSPCLAGRLQNDREVAAIALDYLRKAGGGPEALRSASYILDSMPRVKYRFDDAVPGDTPSDLRASCIFIEAATWPDRVANNDDIDHDEDRPTWHYIGIPINATDCYDKDKGIEPDRELDLDGKKPAELAMDKRMSLNLVQALKLNAAALKDPATPRDRRAIALCWLMNLTAEAGLPSNTSSLYSQQFPHGDDCGRLFMVEDHGKIESWRDFWNSFGEPEKPLMKTIEEQRTPNGREFYYFDTEADHIASYDEWVLSGHNFDNSVRRAGAVKGVNLAKVHEKQDVPKVPEFLYTAADRRVRRGQEISGHRLAWELLEILK